MAELGTTGQVAWQLPLNVNDARQQRLWALAFSSAGKFERSEFPKNCNNGSCIAGSKTLSDDAPVDLRLLLFTKGVCWREDGTHVGRCEKDSTRKEQMLVNCLSKFYVPIYKTYQNKATSPGRCL